MNELERIAQQEKTLKEKKKKALAKAYEKLGRKFYKKKSKAKSFATSNNMFEHIPMFDKNTPISEQDLIGSESINETIFARDFYNK